jgi:hypothetical protein
LFQRQRRNAAGFGQHDDSGDGAEQDNVGGAVAGQVFAQEHEKDSVIEQSRQERSRLDQAHATTSASCRKY